MKLRYYPKAHTYWYGKKKLESVTTYIGKFFSPFNAREIARQLASYPVNKKLKRGVRYWLNEWKEAREHGTRVHETIEKLINNEELGDSYTKLDAAKIAQAGEFINTLKDYSVFISEQKVYDKELGLAGTIDLIVENADGTITLVDWKTNKRITRTGDKYCKKPVNNLKDCNYHKYALQLALYAFILERKDFEIDKLILVHLQEDSYQTYYIKYDYWKPEVEKILELV